MGQSCNAPELFPETRWSAIQRACDEGLEAQQALSGLLRQYLPALRAHLRSRRIAPADAEDLLQGFVADRILEHHLLARAARGRGRFRAFLVASLNHHLANYRRAQRTSRRQPREGRILSLGPELSAPAPAQATDSFERAWARELLAEALRRTQEQCELAGRSDLWSLFQLRVLSPALQNQPAPCYRELVQRLGYRSPAEASNALITAKRVFARTLRQVVEAYCPTGAEEELAQLRRILCSGRA